MIRLVAGDTGEGKTKDLIRMANEAVKTTKGHIVYLDGDSSHIYDLHHSIRYINVSEFPINDYKEFFGFMCGILSEDNDIEQIYVDGLLRMAHLPIENEHTEELIGKLKAVSDSLNVRFVISVNCDTTGLPVAFKEYLVA
ncbi:twitching motility protein PilT [Vallitalea pronyensis]|uniref:Twitching motility protein PilT n=1 Tax=Vallitalea pronyensis TaxID=1348613 RepID=A0A8J8MKT9_9FIRM|nr:twitching motility protein PilT [Vallitalea pronyensis]QUI23341.1 twitching motility protein PilT [Vallitalea pronyensis]